MFRRGEERNYGVLIASIVAIVAIVGMVVYFSEGSAGGAAVVAYSELGDAAYNSCMSGELPAGTNVDRTLTGMDNTMEFTRCASEVCAVFCQGQDSSCAGYCTGRVQSLTRGRLGVW